MRPVIAVVDDNLSVVHLMTQVLIGAGHEVVGCDDLSQAEAVIDERRPDAVLLELRRRNEYAGWMLLRRLRQDDEKRRIPLLVTSGDVALLTRYETDLAAFGVGVLRKPFTVEALLARLTALMRRRHEDEDDPSGSDPPLWTGPLDGVFSVP
jgi:two-component system OmpR family response regulator